MTGSSELTAFLNLAVMTFGDSLRTRHFITISRCDPSTAYAGPGHELAAAGLWELRGGRPILATRGQLKNGTSRGWG